MYILGSGIHYSIRKKKVYTILYSACSADIFQFTEFFGC
jgi:hypothetical protein